LLDAWMRSRLPASEFATLVGLSAATLYQWKKRFEARGPAGLEDGPRGRKGGSRLAEPIRRAIVMLKRAHPDWGQDRIHDVLLRSEGYGASPGAVALVLEEEGYVVEEAPTVPHEAPVRRFERARPNELWQTDLFTFLLKRENRRVHLVAFMDSCGATGYVESSAPAPQFRAFGLADSTLLRAIRAPRATREWTRRRATSCSRRSRRRQDMLSTRPLVSFRGQQPRSDSSCSHWHARATG
jgi:transposase